LDQELLWRALTLGWDDIGDAVQAISAHRANVDDVVTRNASDFTSSPVPAVTPSELLAILQTSRG
jgi:hypothetical protein